MSEIERISVEKAREQMSKGEALLICAYEDDQKFSRVHLDGALSWSEFQVKAQALSRDTELIFYCA